MQVSGWSNEDCYLITVQLAWCSLLGMPGSTARGVYTSPNLWAGMLPVGLVMAPGLAMRAAGESQWPDFQNLWEPHFPQSSEGLRLPYTCGNQVESPGFRNGPGGFAGLGLGRPGSRKGCEVLPSSHPGEHSCCWSSCFAHLLNPNGVVETETLVGTEAKHGVFLAHRYPEAHSCWAPARWKLGVQVPCVTLPLTMLMPTYTGRCHGIVVLYLALHPRKLRENSSCSMASWSSWWAL